LRQLSLITSSSQILIFSTPHPSTMSSPKLFSKENYIWMALGLVLIALGMFLMSGGQSNTDPAVFNKEALYSPIRITVAPILIIVGLVVEVFAIFRKPKSA
jgi:uncharacterized membrane protein